MSDPPMTDAAKASNLYLPKLATMLRDGYGLADLRADAIAGLTVAIVALPLSMAIAIASGVGPERGLYTAIVGGFLVSMLGGSRFQIGGPAGAFIVLVASTVHLHGIDGLVLATFLSGLMLAAGGVLRLGNLVRLIPAPVTVGFTAGIAVIILVSQIRDLLGLTLVGGEPAAFAPKVAALVQALPSLSLPAAAVALGVIVIILAVRRWRPAWPALLIAVSLASGAAVLLNLPVETIGSKFGGVPNHLPMPHLPDLAWPKVLAVLPAAAAFTLLGAIESLLSAVVADGMTGRRHRSNMELVAQGIANSGVALFGGMPVTGTIARTATNVRAGAHTPVSGILHALYLLAFVLIAAPLAAYIPLAALAGLLAVVAWNMVEKAEIAHLLRENRAGAAVMAVTLALTLAHDLIAGIAAGCALAMGLALVRRLKA